MGVSHIIRSLPIFKTRESIAQAAIKHPDLISFEDAQEAVERIEIPENRRMVDIKTVRLQALVEMGADASDPVSDEFKRIEGRRLELISDLEKKYGDDLNRQIKMITAEPSGDGSDVDQPIVEQLEESLTK